MPRVAKPRGVKPRVMLDPKAFAAKYAPARKPKGTVTQ